MQFIFLFFQNKNNFSKCKIDLKIQIQQSIITILLPLFCFWITFLPFWYSKEKIFDNLKKIFQKNQKGEMKKFNWVISRSFRYKISKFLLTFFLFFWKFLFFTFLNRFLFGYLFLIFMTHLYKQKCVIEISQNRNFLIFLFLEKKMSVEYSRKWKNVEVSMECFGIFLFLPSIIRRFSKH